MNYFPFSITIDNTNEYILSLAIRSWLHNFCSAVTKMHENILYTKHYETKDNYFGWKFI